jgi:hypothetical protein
MDLLHGSFSSSSANLASRGRGNGQGGQSRVRQVACS